MRAFVKEHKDKTQVEMAQLWEGEISERNISQGLPKIGVTRKKDLWVSGTGRSAKRAEFLNYLEDRKAPHLVYVDESGMDERDDYGFG